MSLTMCSPLSSVTLIQAITNAKKTRNINFRTVFIYKIYYLFYFMKCFTFLIILKIKFFSFYPNFKSSHTFTPRKPSLISISINSNMAYIHPHPSLPYPQTCSLPNLRTLQELQTHLKVFKLPQLFSLTFV